MGKTVIMNVFVIPDGWEKIAIKISTNVFRILVYMDPALIKSVIIHAFVNRIGQARIVTKKWEQLRQNLIHRIKQLATQRILNQKQQQNSQQLLQEVYTTVWT